MWRALVAGIVLQHVSIQSLLRELRRNPALLEVCGFDRLGPRRRPKREVVVGVGGPKVVLKEVPRGDGVPSAWNFSRFLSSVATLEAERGLMVAMMGQLREQLMEEVEGFGEHLGYDGKAVESHSTGRKSGVGFADGRTLLKARESVLRSGKRNGGCQLDERSMTSSGEQPVETACRAGLVVAS